MSSTGRNISLKKSKSQSLHKFLDIYNAPNAPPDRFKDQLFILSIVLFAFQVENFAVFNPITDFVLYESKLLVLGPRFYLTITYDK